MTPFRPLPHEVKHLPTPDEAIRTILDAMQHTSPTKPVRQALQALRLMLDENESLRRRR